MTVLLSQTQSIPLTRSQLLWVRKGKCRSRRLICLSYLLLHIRRTVEETHTHTHTKCAQSTRSTWTGDSSNRQEGPGWVENTQRRTAGIPKVAGDSDIQVTDFPQWLLHPARAPSKLRHYEATVFQAWFLSRPFLAPSCPDAVAAMAATETSTPQPL